MSKSSSKGLSTMAFAAAVILIGAAYAMAVFMVDYSMYALFAFAAGVFLFPIACGMTPGTDEPKTKKT